MLGDELGDDFGVGVAVEDDAFGLELALEGGVVLDDAVVDDGDQAVAAEVRMGVAIGGRAVRGPAGVADAGAAGRGLIAQMAGQVGDAAGPLAQVQVVAGQRGEAGAVVAAIFQAAQAFEQDRFRFAPSRCSRRCHTCAAPPWWPRNESFVNPESLPASGAGNKTACGAQWSASTTASSSCYCPAQPHLRVLQYAAAPWDLLSPIRLHRFINFSEGGRFRFGVDRRQLLLGTVPAIPFRFFCAVGSVAVAGMP